MITNEALSTKLDLVLKNQEELKAMEMLVLKTLDYLIQHEKGPEDFIRNIIANIAGDEIEWNRRGKFTK
jgi:hypothetical protein|nr:MAG TPA: hypothetical protein [Crassvirales sp.]